MSAPTVVRPQAARDSVAPRCDRPQQGRSERRRRTPVRRLPSRARGARHGARGFTLPAAIFLLVILAALGAYIVNVSSTQHLGAALDAQGVRAYQAARAGIEWGVFRALRASSCAATTSFVLPADLDGFTVTVTCAASLADELGAPVTVYALAATACSEASGGACPAAAPGPAYVERRVSATVSQ